MPKDLTKQASRQCRGPVNLILFWEVIITVARLFSICLLSVVAVHASDASVHLVTLVLILISGWDLTKETRTRAFVFALCSRAFCASPVPITHTASGHMNIRKANFHVRGGRGPQRAEKQNFRFLPPPITYKEKCFIKNIAIHNSIININQSF